MAVPVFLSISAYLRTSKIKKIGLYKSYSIKEITKTLINLLLPYVVVVIIEVFATVLAFKMGFVDSIDNLSSSTSLIKWVLTGTTGDGSYYVPIMVQLIFYFPLVYLTFKISRYFGLTITFVVNLIYELLVYYFSLTPELYRLLIFRYTFILGLGTFLYLSKENKKTDDLIAIIMLFAGFLYLTINSYIYAIPLFQAWKNTSMLYGPFVYGIMYFVVKHFYELKYSTFCEIGKASYHIYLTQMVYYAFGSPILSKILGVTNAFVLLTINLILCISFGYLFYIVEKPIRNKLLKLINR